MPNLTEQLASAFTERTLDLNRFAAGTRQRVLGHLHELSDDLERKIKAANLTPLARARTERLLRESNATISRSMNRVSADVTREMHDLASLTGRETVRLANAVIGADLLNVTLNQADLRAITNANIVGGPAGEWWGKQSARLQGNFATQMRLGVLAGETNQQLVARLRGSATGRRIAVETADGIRKVREFTGGVMSTTTREAQALVRSSVMNVHNQALSHTYAQNRDIIRGEQALATLDNRTTQICIARSGGAWDTKTGEPLPESEVAASFPGPPPWHMQCRTVLVPITKSWEDLAKEARPNSPRMKILNSVPDAQRASMNGRVAGRMTFSDWAKTQPPARIRAQLGAGRYDLWKSGQISLSQLIDQTGRPLSLVQLEKLAELQRLRIAGAAKGRVPMVAPATGRLEPLPATKIKSLEKALDSKIPVEGMTVQQRAERLINELPAGQRGYLSADPRKHAPLAKVQVPSPKTVRAANRGMDRLQDAVEAVGRFTARGVRFTAGTVKAELAKAVGQLAPQVGGILVNPKRLLRVALGTGLLGVGTVSQILSTYANLTYACLKLTFRGSLQGLKFGVGALRNIHKAPEIVRRFRFRGEAGSSNQEGLRRWLWRQIREGVPKAGRAANAKLREVVRGQVSEFKVAFKEHPYQTLISNGLIATPAPFSADVGLAIKSGFKLWNVFNPLNTHQSLLGSLSRAWAQRPKVIPQDIRAFGTWARRALTRKMGWDRPGAFAARGVARMRQYSARWRRFALREEPPLMTEPLVVPSPADMALARLGWMRVGEMVRQAPFAMEGALGGEIAAALVSVPRLRGVLFDPRRLLQAGVGAELFGAQVPLGYLRTQASLVPIDWTAAIRFTEHRTVWTTLNGTVLVPYRASGASWAEVPLSRAVQRLASREIPDRIQAAITSIGKQVQAAGVDFKGRHLVQVSMTTTPVPGAVDLGLTFRTPFQVYDPLSLEKLAREGYELTASRIAIARR